MKDQLNKIAKSVQSAIKGENFVDKKQVEKFLTHSPAEYEGTAGALWNVFKKAQNNWSDHSHSMYYSLVNLRNWLEEKHYEIDRDDPKLANELWSVKNKIHKLEDKAQYVARGALEKGGVAPLGAAKRALRDFTKDFEVFSKELKDVMKKVK